MIPILDSRRMRRADRQAIQSGIPSLELMENAARALVEELATAFPEWKRVVVACGPGNNGGDGLAAARLASGRGLSVEVFTLRDPSLYSGDPAENLARLRALGLSIRAISTTAGFRQFRRALADCDGIVDALFGTGLSLALEGDAARAVSAIVAADRPTLSADLPSGLSADQGGLLGPCVRASRTVAFAAPKPCHVFSPARDRCGHVVVADIGISRRILGAQGSSLQETERSDLARLLPLRPGDSHKGDFGRLAIVAGSRGKAGAAVLSARGALRAGAGLVTVFCAVSIEPIVVSALPETMTHPLPEKDGALAESAAEEIRKSLPEFDAAVVGPGLTTEPGAVAAVSRLLASRLPLVCDADALNAFPGEPSVFSRRAAPTVLTPHPGEAARLLSSSTRAVQADRVGAVRRLARRAGSVVILKGQGSLIAAGQGPITVNPTGTPLMATAGAGDVLAGAVGALLAGGWSAEDAAIAGTYLHGAAGESLSARLGDAGLLAHELADALPRVRARR